MTAAWGAWRLRVEDSVFSSGAGATTAWEIVGASWRLAGIVSGAGATAETGSDGNRIFSVAAVEASGTAGWVCDHATIFGSGTS